MKPALKHKNSATDGIKVPSEILDESTWEGSTGARPLRTTIPPGACVLVRAEFALRRRSSWGGSEHAGMIIPSTVQQLAPQLKPEGAEAVEMFENIFHDQLPSVVRAFAEAKRAAQGETKDRFITSEAAEAKIEAAVRAAVASLTPRVPEAQPRFLDEDTKATPAK